MMDPDRWAVIMALFHDVADLSDSERGAFLLERCGDEPGLASEVLALLEADGAGHTLLDAGLEQAARRVLGSDLDRSAPHEFGPYRVIRLLGEGGSGNVYLAERPDLDHLVAIKMLRGAWLSPGLQLQFAREQRTLARLNHPAIARLYHAGALADGTPWFAMEYVEGTPFTEHCRHTRSIREALRSFRGVCEAVQHAHQHAVIHRDLKPSNILVTPDGNVKLLDFGIAKRLEELGVPADRTRTGFRMMTPAYAAPEQLSGGQLGVHTDIYSLGVVLYEVLAGRLPFDLSTATPGEIEATILNREPEKPSTVSRSARARRETPAEKRDWADLDVLCLTAMHKDPARRYPTAEALIRDIDHFLGGRPLDARPDAVTYRIGKFARRNWRALAGAGVAVLLLAGLIAGYTSRLIAARDAASAKSKETLRIERFMTDLFQGGDPEAGPSESLRVVTLLARGVHEAQTLDREPGIQAALFVTLGRIYQQLGDLGRADSLMTRGLERQRSLLGPDDPEVAESIESLGLLRRDQSSLDEAEQLVRQAIDIQRRRGPRDGRALARANVSLGSILEQRGDYPEAIRVLTEALRVEAAPAGPSSDLRDRAATLTELANCHFYAGRYDVSDSLNREVLGIDRALYGERHPHVASDLMNLGAIRQERGEYAESEALLRPALEIYRSWYGERHPETASALTMIARAVIPQGRLDEAASMLEEALSIREATYGEIHPNVASTLNELGRVALAQGKLDSAEADFRRMREIYRAAYHDRHYLIGLAQENLGVVYLKRKRFREAEGLFRDGMREYAETLPPDHPYIGIARIKLGRSLLRQKRYSEAEQESRAGYDSLEGRSDAPASWLDDARQDLAEEYSSLNEPEKAARFRAERTAGGDVRSAQSVDRTAGPSAILPSPHSRQ